MFDKQYYIGKKNEINQKFRKAEQKYIDMAVALGKEYVSFQERVAELQEDLKDLDAKERESQAEENKKPLEGSKGAKNEAKRQ